MFTVHNEEQWGCKQILIKLKETWGSCLTLAVLRWLKKIWQLSKALNKSDWEKFFTSQLYNKFWTKLEHKINIIHMWSSGHSSNTTHTGEGTHSRSLLITNHALLLALHHNSSHCLTSVATNQTSLNWKLSFPQRSMHLALQDKITQLSTP